MFLGVVFLGLIPRTVTVRRLGGSEVLGLVMAVRLSFVRTKTAYSVRRAFKARVSVLVYDLLC